MRDVYVAAVGMTRFGKYPDRPIEDMGREAVLNAITDAGIQRSDIEETFCGTGFGGPLLGQRILRDLGMTGRPITNVENACSSGTTALREGITAIRLGRVDTALAIGIDKLTRFGTGGTVPLETTDIEVGQGMVMPALYAMRARRYMHEYGATSKHLAMVSVKAHKNGALNPLAQFQKVVDLETVLGSRMIADPLTLYMCCPTGDGAAAVILTTKEKVQQWGVPGIKVAASVLQSGRYETGFRNMAVNELTTRTSKLAYEQAGLGPQDISLAEVHDAFAIAEMLYYEALGFCGAGEAKNLLERGETEITGRIPVNPGGGLKCRGHPVGATGVAQVCEAVWQLRGQAGQRQVQGAKVALTHATGGGIAGLDHGACSIHIFTN
ncbi:MAG: thiolase family protein [Anaerolineales bacterium]|nr:MAG: thiolase family protein [Anaerolineales bacterium]